MTGTARYQAQALHSEVQGVATYRGVDPVTGLPVLIYRFSGAPREGITRIDSRFMLQVLAYRSGEQDGLVVAAFSSAYLPAIPGQPLTAGQLLDSVQALAAAAASGLVHGSIRAERFLLAGESLLLEGYGVPWQPERGVASLADDVRDWANAVRTIGYPALALVSALLDRAGSPVADDRPEPARLLAELTAVLAAQGDPENGEDGEEQHEAELPATGAAGASDAAVTSGPAGSDAAAQEPEDSGESAAEPSGIGISAAEPADSESPALEPAVSGESAAEPAASDVPDAAPALDWANLRMPGELDTETFSQSTRPEPAIQAPSTSPSTAPSTAPSAEADFAPSEKFASERLLQRQASAASAAVPAPQASGGNRSSFVKDVPPGSAYRTGSVPEAEHGRRRQAAAVEPAVEPAGPVVVRTGNRRRLYMIAALLILSSVLAGMAYYSSRGAAPWSEPRAAAAPAVVYIVDVQVEPANLPPVTLHVLQSPPGSGLPAGTKYGTVPRKIGLSIPGTWVFEGRFQGYTSEPVTIRIPEEKSRVLLIEIPVPAAAD